MNIASDILCNWLKKNNTFVAVYQLSYLQLLQPHELQHASLLCPSVSPEFAQTHDCWVSDTIHPFFARPFSSCTQFFPASESFPMSWLFTSGGQSTGVSASVLPMNIQCWFSLGLTDLSSFQSEELSRDFYITIIWKNQIFEVQPSLWSNSHICM